MIGPATAEGRIARPARIISVRLSPRALRTPREICANSARAANSARPEFSAVLQSRVRAAPPPGTSPTACKLEAATWSSVSNCGVPEPEV